MIGMKHFRLPGARATGLILAGLLAGGLALASGTAFASSSAPAGGMGGMSGLAGMGTASSPARTGFTKGFFAGHTVRFFYSKNFRCAEPPAATASSKCEGGTNYTQTPASTFDPLYVIVPLGFTPPKNTLQCPAGHCIDHPHTIDLTSVLGPGTCRCLRTATSWPPRTAASPSGGTWTSSGSRACRPGTS
jgi:hypothetical protein